MGSCGSDHRCWLGRLGGAGLGGVVGRSGRSGRQMLAGVGRLVRQVDSTRSAGVLAGVWQLAESIQKDASRSGRRW